MQIVIAIFVGYSAKKNIEVQLGGLKTSSGCELP